MQALYYFILTYPSLIVLTGLFGLLLWEKNIILALLSLEIMHTGVLLGFVLTSIYLDDIFGIIMAMFGLAMTGAELALGLTFTIILYELVSNIDTKSLQHLKA